jgi:hypothetical protein
VVIVRMAPGMANHDFTQEEVAELCDLFAEGK